MAGYLNTVTRNAGLTAILPLLASVIMVSCAREGGNYAAPDDITTDMNFELALDRELVNGSDDGDGVTKANTGSGNMVNWCVMELFYNSQSVGQYTSAVVSGSTVFKVQLVAGRTYSAAFWAEYRDGTEGRYNTESLKNVSYKNSYSYDDDSMDAFCARIIDFVTYQNPTPVQLTLTRPFSLVTVNGTYSSISASFQAPGIYDVLDDTLTGISNFTYTTGSFFVLTADSAGTMDMSISRDGGEAVQLGSVPVQRNYKTNISFSD